MKLAAKLISALLIGLLCLLILDGYLAYQREVEFVDRELNQDALELGTNLDDWIAETWLTRGEQDALRLIREMNQEQPRIRWVWLDARPGEADCPRASQAELRDVVQGKFVSLVHHERGGGKVQLTYVRIQPSERGRVGALEIAQHPDYRHAVRVFVVRMFILTSVTILLGGVLVVAMGRQFVGKPLARLIEHTRRIGRGDLSRPLDMPQKDEFGELAGAINSMSAQLLHAQQKAIEEAAARMSATAQLRHAEKLHTVGRLASGIAHELGTPLNVVSGRAGLIASGKLSADETRESALIIKSETERITRIIRQLLDFARPNTPQKTRADLREVVADTLKLLGPLAASRNYDLTVNRDEHPVWASVDVSQIQQVLTNLLMNSAQAMPDGGPIEIEIRAVADSVAREGQRADAPLASIAVRDRGVGIAPENLEHIFEPFFTTKEVGMGTGLGLSISYGIVEEHGGWIEVESELQQGSCFTIYLPAESAPRQDEP